MGKLVLFLVVVVLISLVLFLSYQMDKRDISQKRKEKIEKNNIARNNLKTEEDIYNFNKEPLIQETVQINTDEIKNKLNNDYTDDNEYDIDDALLEYEDILNDENLENIINEEDIKENLDEEIINSDLSDEVLEEIVDLNDIEDVINDENESDLEENVVEDFNENEEDEEIEESEKIEEVEKINSEDIEPEEIEETPKISIEDLPIENESMNEFTMVFNSKLLKSTDEILEEDDEDFELEELENAIAEANIKKYTRNKKGAPKLESKKEMPKHKSSDGVKRYTRKKEPKKETEIVKEEKKSSITSNVKRYTGKKIKRNIPSEEISIEDKFINSYTDILKDDDTEIKEEKKLEKPKLKRGRPKKSDTPKRGRPKKVVTPKRGRPKKEDKPKRGRPKKSEREATKKKTASTKKETK